MPGLELYVTQLVIFGRFLVKTFQKLGFRKRIGLRLGKILEFSKFLEFSEK